GVALFPATAGVACTPASPSMDSLSLRTPPAVVELGDRCALQESARALRKETPRKDRGLMTKAPLRGIHKGYPLRRARGQEVLPGQGRATAPHAPWRGGPRGGRGTSRPF